MYLWLLTIGVPRGVITNRRRVEQPEGAEMVNRATIKAALSTPSKRIDGD